MLSKSEIKLIERINSLPDNVVFRAYLKALKQGDKQLSNKILIKLPIDRRMKIKSIYELYERRDLAFCGYIIYKALEIIEKYNHLAKKIYGFEKWDKKIESLYLKGLANLQNDFIYAIKDTTSPKLLPEEDFNSYREIIKILRVSDSLKIDKNLETIVHAYYEIYRGVQDDAPIEKIILEKLKYCDKHHKNK